MPSFFPEQDTRQHRHRGIPGLSVGEPGGARLWEPSNAEDHLFVQNGPHLEARTLRVLCLPGRDPPGSLLPCPGVFFELLLDLFLGIGVKRPRNHFAPSVAIKEPINDRMMEYTPDPLI